MSTSAFGVEHGISKGIGGAARKLGLAHTWKPTGGPQPPGKQIYESSGTWALHPARLRTPVGSRNWAKQQISGGGMTPLGAGAVGGVVAPAGVGAKMAWDKRKKKKP